MSFYNNIVGMSVGFDICPITGEKATYNFSTPPRYSGAGISYKIPSLNPHTIIFLVESTLDKTSRALLVKHRERIKQRIINTQAVLFYMDGKLAEELQRF